MAKKQKTTFLSNGDFDPVKKMQGGEAAEKVIWTTNSLNAAVKAMNEGLPLKANPFVGKNTMLLKPDLVYKRTAEELDDYIKCKLDPVYFASKCFLMTPEGLKPCVLRDYQIDYLKHLQEHRFSIFLSCRQSGKCNSLISNCLYKINLKKLNFFYNSAHIKEKLDYFYINYQTTIEGDYMYFLVPQYEILNIYDNSIIGKTRYYLYKLINKIERWQEKLDKREQSQMRRAKDAQSITRKEIQS